MTECCQFREQIAGPRYMHNAGVVLPVMGMLLAQAVDRPELHHLVNVLVFPQHGLRSHANETSGGDLDGLSFSRSLFFSLLLLTGH